MVSRPRIQTPNLSGAATLKAGTRSCNEEFL